MQIRVAHRGHFGFIATKRRAERLRFQIPNCYMQKYIHDCIVCWCYKRIMKCVPFEPFKRVRELAPNLLLGMDLIRPWPTTQQSQIRYVVSTIDHFSRYIMNLPCRQPNANVIVAPLQKWNL